MRHRERLFCYVVAAVFMLFLLGPVIWMLSISFKGPLAVFSKPPKLVDDFTLVNYAEVLTDPLFVQSFFNSVVTSTATALFSMLLAIPAAYGLSRLKSKARVGLISWVLLVRASPGMIFVIPYFVVFTRVGLIDTKLGLVLINTVFTVPLAIWVLIPFFQAIPTVIEEAARIDGATRFQTMTRIAFPLAAPGIASTAILVFIFSWNEFLFALNLTQFDAKTAPIAILTYMAYEGTDWGKVSAAGVVILLPVLVFAVLIRRYLVQTTAGAVKG
jgi:multiple sugar transport system permease protein